MVSIFKTQCCFSLLVSSEEKRGKKKERVREREKRGKREQWMQHMISTWGCRNSEFISMTHWRNQTGEREGGRAEGARKERGRKKRRKRNRGREGGRERERGERKGSPKKDRERGRERERERERESGVKEQTTCGCGGSDLVMEGDKFSGKTICQSRWASEWRTKV